jgi:hypothetical protein
MKFILANSHGLREHAHDADAAVLVFTRTEIELQRVDVAVDRLRALSEDGAKVRRLAGKMVLMFEGYDTDARSLVEIPACVRFFRAIDREWSYWLHFLVPAPDVISLALLMLLDVKVGARDKVRSAFQVEARADLEALMTRLFDKMNALHYEFNIPEQLNREITEAVMTALSDATYRRESRC